MTLREMVFDRLAQLQIKPKRSMGQNFLISEPIVAEIFKCVDLVAPDFIIEVGPGLGVLTEKIIEKKISHRLIEMDSHIFKFWQNRGQPVVEIDALKYDWQNEVTHQNTLVLSNLPYQIGSRLVIEISTGSRSIQNMILMFQKEVAERLIAKPKTKDYSFLSVVVQSFWEVEKVVDARSADFYPAPNVDSRVVRLKRKEVSQGLNRDYVAFVKQAYQHRRKFMIKAFGDNQNLIVENLARLGYSAKVRAEEIKVLDFQTLFLAYKKALDGH